MMKLILLIMQNQRQRKKIDQLAGDMVGIIETGLHDGENSKFQFGSMAILFKKSFDPFLQQSY